MNESMNVGNITNMSFVNGTESPEVESGRPWSLTFAIILSVILSISSLLAIFGNVMVVMVVVRHRGMRTRTNLFLVNLAIADFLVGLLAVPASITTLIAGTWVFGTHFCIINGFLNAFCLFASIHTLMYISIHKYYSITRPFSTSFSIRCVVLMMACTWIWAGFCATTTVTGLTHVIYKDGTSQCGPVYPHDGLSYIHHAIILISDFIIPLAILMFCYTRMFKEIRAHSKRLQENTTLEQDVVLAQQKKVAVTLFIVLACFIICWLPWNFYTVYVTIRKDKEHFSEYINPLVYMLGYLNSACNPIIYAFRSPSFREGYKEILCQTPTYVISDDTLHEEGMMSFRRLSNFFAGKGRTGRSPSSPDQEFMYHSTTSLNVHLKNNPRAKFKRDKSLTELMRQASKRGNGNSIIQQDDSLVIMKGGKIVSIRRQNELPKGSPLASKRGIIFKPREGLGTTDNGGYSNTVELAPLITNGRLSSAVENKMDDRNFCGSDEVFDKTGDVFGATSDTERTKETKFSDNCHDNESEPSDTQKLLSSPVITVNKTESIENDIGRDLNIIISEDDSILSAMPLTPSTKKRLARSDLFLDMDHNDDKDDVEARKLQSAQSSEGLPRGPLLRFPSVEHLDIPHGIPRSASDNNFKKLKSSPKPSPLARRRWTFSKVKT